VPVLALDEIFGLSANEPTTGTTTAAGAAAENILVPVVGPTRRKLIIVRRNGQPFAFAVDRMLGRQEVVVRPLEDPLVKVEGVPGSTDLGDGRPTLVLDLGALGGRLAPGAGEAAL
jgi:chemotaxis protein histidine kinase CheA